MVEVDCEKKQVVILQISDAIIFKNFNDTQLGNEAEAKVFTN